MEPTVFDRHCGVWSCVGDECLSWRVQIWVSAGCCCSEESSKSVYQVIREKEHFSLSTLACIPNPGEPRHRTGHVNLLAMTAPIPLAHTHSLLRTFLRHLHVMQPKRLLHVKSVRISPCGRSHGREL